ncbi:permease component of ABC-type sugar transporter [Halobacteroides halobius DSM 5150]|uniref:Permease component of ABC-type sugar transporter n=1 Tax=Halobacteroides halobius (strain ATCC 35273 / DSM 5150 / MD-1) TaxID=748449 RepID=L0KAU0_HALHC|nr:sugar ABC transporter permease [Halobacteroides halobius]AGB41489.1 permease component of ABC-type sugar transporter [Halobacteroides halobius DSM 5150]
MLSKLKEINPLSQTEEGPNTGLSEAQLAFLLVAPALLVITAVALYPVLKSVWLSLFQMNLKFGNTKFIGLQNYIELFKTPRYWGATWNTIYFTVISVFFEATIGLVMALLMNRSFKGRGLFRASVLIPWAIPTVISAMMWKLMYNPQMGVINDILLRLGVVDQTVSWLGQESLAMWAAIIADVWKTSPFMALMLLAGLQTIPGELYEAAEIDGANKWQKFKEITFPLLKPSLLVALLFRTLRAFRVFGLLRVLTGGGPANSTESLSLYSYNILFSYLQFGKGSAASVTVFVGVLIISYIYIKVLGTDPSRD